MRRAPLGLLLVALVAGCGKRERTAALAPVRVQLTEPRDLAEVDDRTVTVRGRVTPLDARVLVDGVQAAQRGGEFSAEVELSGGVNVIDVQAAAPRHPAAFAALRVTRIVPIEIPDVGGLSPGDAADRLAVLGLGSELRETNPIDFLLPGTLGVCGTDPEQGTKVRTGTVVTLLAQKSC